MGAPGSLPIRQPDWSRSCAIHTTQDEFDFDFHGLARVRLAGPRAVDVEAVGRQLGVVPVPARGSADLIIDYRAHGPEPRGSAWMVGTATASSDDRVFLRDASGRTWTSYSFADSPTLRLERAHGSGKVPLLTQLIAAIVRSRGVTPIHASGFVWNGKGVLVMGWSKGGKTELVLPFMERGATFVGDEWMYLVDGRMFGLHEPIRIWDWHLTDLPGLRARLPASARRRLRVLGRMEQMARLFGRLPLAPEDGTRRIAELINRQRFVQLTPDALWGGRTTQNVEVDRIVLVVARPSDTVELYPIESGQVAEHMAFSNIEEMRPLSLLSDQMRFVNPHVSAFVNHDPSTEARRLEAALSGVDAAVLTHPYPAPTQDLFSTLRTAL